MVEAREAQNFMLVTADVGTIAPAAEVGVNLEALKVEFGNNFNTLTVLNNASEEISIKLNGRKVQFIKGDGGIFALDWEDNIKFDDVRIINEHASTTPSANEIRISVGRTGVNR